MESYENINDVLQLESEDINKIIIPLFGRDLWNQMNEIERMVTRIRFLVYMKYEKSRGQWTCKQYLTEVVPHVVLASEIDTQYAGDILVYIYSLDHAPYLKAEVTDAYGNYIYNNTADYYIYVCAVRDDSENNGSKEPEAELHTPDLPSGSESTEDKN